MALWIPFLVLLLICCVDLWKWSVFLTPQVPFLQCGYHNNSWLPAAARSIVKPRDHKCSITLKTVRVEKNTTCSHSKILLFKLYNLEIDIHRGLSLSTLGTSLPLWSERQVSLLAFLAQLWDLCLCCMSLGTVSKTQYHGNWTESLADVTVGN